MYLKIAIEATVSCIEFVGLKLGCKDKVSSYIKKEIYWQQTFVLV